MGTAAPSRSPHAATLPPARNEHQGQQSNTGVSIAGPSQTDQTQPAGSRSRPRPDSLCNLRNSDRRGRPGGFAPLPLLRCPAFRALPCHERTHLVLRQNPHRPRGGTGGLRLFCRADSRPANPERSIVTHCCGENLRQSPQLAPPAVAGQRREGTAGIMDGFGRRCRSRARRR